MQDRVPTKPGRVLVTPENGAAPYYAVMTRADEPTQEGTPLNKGTLLSDATAALLGDVNTPDEAFLAMMVGVGKYGFKIHVEIPGGYPAVGATISGLTSLSGGSVVTDNSGDAIGVSTAASLSVTVTSPYIDIMNKSVRITSTGKVTNTVVALEATDAKEMTITNSKTSEFSPLVSIFDLCLVAGGGGGGGGGRTGIRASLGGGGGGGYVTNVLNRSTIADGFKFRCTVGSGGNQGAVSTGESVPAEAGGNGGRTTVTLLQSNASFSADGGNGGGGGGGPKKPGGNGGIGGYGNGNGGNGGDELYEISGTSGGQGSGYKFNDPSAGIAGGGGGGGGCFSKGSTLYGWPGGDPYGGTGGAFPLSISLSPINASPGRGPGGGGGGDVAYNDPRLGKGSNGIIYVRWRYE